jgi:quercetin dioxygenase-like cupin family protein
LGKRFDEAGSIAEYYEFESLSAFPLAAAVADPPGHGGGSGRCAGNPGDRQMLSITPTRPRSGLVLAGLAAGMLLAGIGSAFASQCPADKVVADGMGQKPGATAPKDVTDVVLSSIDVAQAPFRIEGRLFRLRRLVIEPGGVVPWHSHADRPAIIYTVQGEMTEYASNCAVPILHRAGDAVAETHMVSHWWRNEGKQRAILISADLLHDPADAHTM